MKKTFILVGFFLVASAAQPKEKPYDKGVLLQMESVPCGYSEKGGKTIAGEILGTDDQHKKTQETLCQEYVLQADRVTYRIRPRDEKHPVLLPVGESAEFRIEKDKLILRIPEFNDKDHDYSVLSITPRADAQNVRSAKSEPGH